MRNHISCLGFTINGENLSGSKSQVDYYIMAIMWQDTVIAICQGFFVLSLVPMVRGHEKPPLSTCLMSVTLVGIITFTLASLKLWFSVLTAAMIGLMWIILTAQKLQIRRNANEQ